MKGFCKSNFFISGEYSKKIEQYDNENNETFFPKCLQNRSKDSTKIFLNFHLNIAAKYSEKSMLEKVQNTIMSELNGEQNNSLECNDVLDIITSRCQEFKTCLDYVREQSDTINMKIIVNLLQKSTKSREEVLEFLRFLLPRGKFLEETLIYARLNNMKAVETEQIESGISPNTEKG